MSRQYGDWKGAMNTLHRRAVRIAGRLRRRINATAEGRRIGKRRGGASELFVSKHGPRYKQLQRRLNRVRRYSRKMYGADAVRSSSPF